MYDSTRRCLIYAGFLFIIAAAVLVEDRTVLAMAMTDDCDSICGPTASCEESCWWYPEGQPGQETTCGEYDGGVVNGWCQSTCGDDICSGIWAGEDCNSCSDDCRDCPPVTCGNDTCEAHESWRTCPEDCEDPGEGEPPEGYCGDLICDSTEDESCDDCIIPDEFCGGFKYVCPTGWQCVGNECVYEQEIGSFPTCEDTKTDADCNSGYRCREATNIWTQQVQNICIPWYLDLN